MKRIIDLTQGQLSPTQPSLRAPGSAPFLSVTVQNATNCAIGLYLGRDVSGAPDVIVPAGIMQTLPIEETLLGLAVQPVTGQGVSGKAYVVANEFPLTASSSAASSSSGGAAVWDYSNWDASTWG